MSIFNEKMVESMFTRNYTCPECGGKMEFEDENEDTLVCPSCGHDMDLDRYGFDSDEEYDAAYPSKEDV
jgi:transcription initiation factor IIE alpha subunit